MPQSRLDRLDIEFRSVNERDSKFRIESLAVDPDTETPDPGEHGADLDRLAKTVLRAREAGKPVVICHGAHLIKNGLGSVLIRMVEEGWLQHIATNGAGSIHDWEFGCFGRSCEDVRAYVAEGQFGIWDETGGTIGSALLTGAFDDLGYGESVGRVMVNEELAVPSREDLEKVVSEGRGERRAAAADLLSALELEAGLKEGVSAIAHPYAKYSVQANCYRKGIPFTVHPGIGQDIIYTHPLFQGGSVGRTSMSDFLAYAESVRTLAGGGVYISAGSSVMSPMIFEKSVSMARNLARRGGEPFENFHIAVNDLMESTWDWSQGEPPIDNPAYYVRFCKSFSRMGGDLSYFGMDNRAFLLGLYHRLRDA